MASFPSKPGAAVLDASLAVAFCAREVGKFPAAKAQLEKYALAGYAFFAPAVIIGEVLHVLCRKLFDAHLSASEYAAAAQEFIAFMRAVRPPPSGDASLIDRAIQLRRPAGCSTSSDAIYLALAEQLAVHWEVVALTFDEGRRKNTRSR